MVENALLIKNLTVLKLEVQTNIILCFIFVVTTIFSVRLAVGKLLTIKMINFKFLSIRYICVAD